MVVGGEGAVARAILSDTAECPAITIGTSPGPMRVRAKPDSGDKAAFPILVCEAPIPSDATSAAIEGRALPLPKPTLSAVAALGDTGCRLKAAKTQVQGDHDYHPAGQFQDCDLQSKWPFSRLSHTVAARKPDLVVHVGDYIYRESPCPQGDAGCKGSPYGDNWQTWQADFFTPAEALLAAAPWIATRGNHEICKRAGTGYFRFLDPNLALGDTPPACIDYAAPDTANIAGKSFIVMDLERRQDFARTTPVTAHPMRRCSPVSSWRRQRVRQPPPDLGDRTELHAQPHAPAAMSAWGGKLPDGIDLALAGHMHMWELLTFTDQRSPQLIVGTGGTALDPKIERSLAGMKVGGATVRFGRAERDWGFTMLMPGQGGTGWTATFVTLKGKAKFACRIERAQVILRTPGDAGSLNAYALEEAIARRSSSTQATDPAAAGSIFSEGSAAAAMLLEGTHILLETSKFYRRLRVQAFRTLHRCPRRVGRRRSTTAVARYSN